MKDQFYPPVRWFESDANVLSMEEQSSSGRELQKLYQEAQEYDFLTGKTPQDLPNSWEEEE
jgi:hypothetical protein